MKTDPTGLITRAELLSWPTFPMSNPIKPYWSSPGDPKKRTEFAWFNTRLRHADWWLSKVLPETDSVSPGGQVSSGVVQVGTVSEVVCMYIRPVTSYYGTCYKNRWMTLERLDWAMAWKIVSLGQDSSHGEANLTVARFSLPIIIKFPYAGWKNVFSMDLTDWWWAAEDGSGNIIQASAPQPAWSACRSTMQDLYFNSGDEGLEVGDSARTPKGKIQWGMDLSKENWPAH